MMPASAFNGLRVLVVGLAKSGQASAAALHRHGAQVTAVDGADTEQLREVAEALRAKGIAIHLGADLESAAWLTGTDVVVASPGVPPHVGVLRHAMEQDAPVWGEPELAFRLNSGRSEWFAVTGTNGKTSTTELLAACIDAPAAGNIGSPLVALLDVEHPPARVAVELSSFQLAFTPTMQPEVAVLLNLAPDHLDWHGSFTSYREAKSRIWRYQAPQQAVVLNADDSTVVQLANDYPPPGRTVWFSTTAATQADVAVEAGTLVSRLPDASGVITSVRDMAVTGPHHVANAAAVAAAALIAGVDLPTVAHAVQRFHPGVHRMETVAEVDEITWVNDSKATNPHAALAALGAFDSVVWIAGGQNKGLTFDGLVPALASRARAVLAIGSAADEIVAAGQRAGVTTRHAGTLEQAVTTAAGIAEPGDTVLFSPACASFDQFSSYAARGDAFRTAVVRLLDSRARERRSHA